MVRMGYPQLKDMLNDSGKRPIAIWGLRTYLAQLASSEPDEAKSLLPANLEAMSGEELFQVYDTYLQDKLQGSPLEDCQELERAAAPSAEARVNKKGRPVLRRVWYLCIICDVSRIGIRGFKLRRSVASRPTKMLRQFGRIGQSTNHTIRALKPRWAGPKLLRSVSAVDFLVPSKAWERGMRCKDATLRPFVGTLRVESPSGSALTSGRKRVLRGDGVTRPAKQRNE